MRINTNIAALNALHNVGNTENEVAKSMGKLSSGFRINRAGDDAAGLGVANKLRADIRSSTQASRNAEQAGAVLQIIDGATSSVQTILERMKELATQSASDSVDSTGRTRINQEFSDLRSEIGRIVDTTKFQGTKLLDGGFGNSVALGAGTTVLAAGNNFNDVHLSGTGAGSYTLTETAGASLTLTNGTVTQTIAGLVAGKQSVNFSSFGLTIDTNTSFSTGATLAAQGGAAGGLLISVAPGASGGAFMVSSSGDYTGQDMISLSTIDLKTAAGAGELHLDASELTTLSGAQSALTAIDTAINQVNTYTGKIGAAQNRVDYAVSNIKTSIQNFSAAQSVIRDVDMAEEMTTFSKNQVLSQAGTAMLAQANKLGDSVLTLLRG